MKHRTATPEMLKYIRRIRNAEKRDYALRLLNLAERSAEDRDTIVEPKAHFTLATWPRKLYGWNLNRLAGEVQP
jgi:hypothetical protein